MLSKNVLYDIDLLWKRLKQILKAEALSLNCRFTDCSCSKLLSDHILLLFLQYV